jgi:hypothetical protein
MIGDRLDGAQEDEVGNSCACRGPRQVSCRQDIHPAQLPAHLPAVDRKMRQSRQVDHRVGTVEGRAPVGIRAGSGMCHRIGRAGGGPPCHRANPIARVPQGAHQMPADEASGTGHYHQPGGGAAGPCSIVNAGTIHALIV